MRWCLTDSREMPSRVSSSDVVFCLDKTVRTMRSGNCWEEGAGEAYFSRRDFMMSLADDMLTLIWSSRSQNAWTSSSLCDVVASCTSGMAIRMGRGTGKMRERDLR